MAQSRLFALLVAGLLAAPGAVFAEDPPAPEAPAPEAPAPEEPAAEPEAPAPAPEAGAPAPEVKVPTGPRRWMLGLSHGPLRHVREGGQTYHYVMMTVSNDTGLAREWRPFVQAVVDATRTHVVCGCQGALEEVRRRERTSSLLTLEASAGRLAPGDKRTFVAIFGPIDATWNRLTVLVQGLVNPVVIHRVQKYGTGTVKVDDAEVEPIVVADAAYEARNEKIMAELQKAAKASGGAVPAPTLEYQEFVERRAYAMEWQRQGDEFRPEDDPIEFVREGWRVIGHPLVQRRWVPKAGGGS